MILQILNELNKENGSNYKISILKKHSDNSLLRRVLAMTYDRVKYTYGITTKNLAQFQTEKNSELNLNDALDLLESTIITRQITGHDAIKFISQIISNLSNDEAIVFKKILDHDLKINIGRTNILKIFPKLINKPNYMRCNVYSQKTIKKINFPAMLQLKADGTYREFMKLDDHIQCRSRSGEFYDYPILNEQILNMKSGVYIGELTVNGIIDRAEANGLINSLEPPHNDIILNVWDFLTIEEYNSKKSRIYKERFEDLKMIISESKNIKIIEHHIVQDLKAALKQTSQWMKEGLEGSILKDFRNIFEDGTSSTQLKIKLEISVEMRCYGFQDGTIGSKREGKIGSILFENDEGTIRGKCSGFNDDMLNDIHKNREHYIGKVLEIRFNDLTKARDSDTYALSHPRFIEWRNDKNQTDTIEKCFELREMAYEIG